MDDAEFACPACDRRGTASRNPGNGDVRTREHPETDAIGNAEALALDTVIGQVKTSIREHAIHITGEQAYARCARKRLRFTCGHPRSSSSAFPRRCIGVDACS